MTEEQYVKPHAEMSRGEWLAWMKKQQDILRILQRMYEETTTEGAVRVYKELDSYSAHEIARACAEGAVCLYLKTREATK